MIKFFRNIRRQFLSQNRFSKYFLYVVGEIVLVVVGILIALQVNNWNESLKTAVEAQEYIKSFSEENNLNKNNLIAALEFSRSKKNGIDTLKYILVKKKYSDIRIKPLISSMMSLANFRPSKTTMENITASGKFDLIKDIELRKTIINTYNAYKTTATVEGLISDYVSMYITPFLFNNVRFSDFSSIKSDFTQDPLFENIVIGYEVLLNQQISGYERNLEKLNLLNEQLSTINNSN